MDAEEGLFIGVKQPLNINNMPQIEVMRTIG